VRQAFGRTVPREVDALVAAGRAGKWQQVRDLAHGLKSAARIAGAEELEALCRRLEQARNAEALVDSDRLPQASRRALDALQLA
jgi:HPt (histidine-containing phosphotransfer) domain-containing protein